MFEASHQFVSSPKNVKLYIQNSQTKYWCGRNLKKDMYTMVGDYINTMKTTFDFNFDLYQALKQHGYA